MKFFYLFVSLFFFLSPTLEAQTSDSTKLVTIVTKQKKLITGKLINITSDSIFINSDEKGRMRISRINVKNVYEGLLPPHFLETTNSSVPFYVQSALPNGSGNHYYKNYYIFGNEFNFGVTDNLNLSVGFETGTLIFDSGNQLPLIQLGGKYGFRVGESVHFALSSKVYFTEEAKVILIDSPITFGGKRTNITFSPSLFFEEGDRHFGVFSNLSLALSERSRFIFDYAYIDEVGIAAIMYEYLFKSGFTLSVGGLVADGGGVPNLSFSIPFGNWKIK